LKIKFLPRGRMLAELGGGLPPTTIEQLPQGKDIHTIFVYHKLSTYNFINLPLPAGRLATFNFTNF
jgi:hypothetical protein